MCVSMDSLGFCVGWHLFVAARNCRRMVEDLSRMCSTRQRPSGHQPVKFTSNLDADLWIFHLVQATNATTTTTELFCHTRTIRTTSTTITRTTCRDSFHNYRSLILRRDLRKGSAESSSIRWVSPLRVIPWRRSTIDNRSRLVLSLLAVERLVCFRVILVGKSLSSLS